METLIIEISQEQRDEHKKHTGVPFVSPEISVVIGTSSDDPYLLVRNMHGFNDRDVQAILENCDHYLARFALELVDGCPVDMRATCLPKCDRLYFD